MSNWDKDLFIEHLREHCNREIAKVGVSIIEFTEKHADDISWGRGTDPGTLTFRFRDRCGPCSTFSYDIYWPIKSPDQFHEE
ncbi:hypothetical protein Ct9H90mP12_2680 [bacterium]|nr:MAG: hypothetical protein Ct9H90mP12_2680 [bacterium]